MGESIPPPRDPPSPAIYHSEVNKDRNAKEERPSR